jgi:hypothetical protein
MQERAAAIAALIIAQVEKGRLAWSIPELDEAGLIGKSESYEAINTGRLLAVKRGRSTKILAPDLIAYLQALPLIDPKKPSLYREIARRARRVANERAAATAPTSTRHHEPKG